MLLQIELIESLLSPNHLSSGLIAFLCAYLMFKVSVEKDIKSIWAELKSQQDATKKIEEMNTKMQLIEKDVSYLNSNLGLLTKNYENLNGTINKVQTDIHTIKGSMGAVEGLLKQMLKDK